MPDLDPAGFDLPTLAALAGAAANEHLLSRLRAGGFDGIRASHGYVIQLLIDESPTVGELAERLGVTQQAASKSVGELERMSLVTRAIDATDSRIRRVGLSERGRDALDRARANRLELEGQVRADVGDLSAVKAALVALLQHSGGLESVTRRRVRLPAEG